jgi:hypothetical protein
MQIRSELAVAIKRRISRFHKSKPGMAQGAYTGARQRFLLGSNAKNQFKESPGFVTLKLYK